MTGYKNIQKQEVSREKGSVSTIKAADQREPA